MVPEMNRFRKSSSNIILIFTALLILCSCCEVFFFDIKALLREHRLLIIVIERLMMIIPIALVIAIEGPDIIKRINFNKPKIFLSVFLGVGSVLLVLAYIFVCYKYFSGAHAYEWTLRELVDNVKNNFLVSLSLPWLFIKNILNLFFVVAVIEEVFWRGIVQNLLEQSLRPWLAIIATSALFGLWHIIYLTLMGYFPVLPMIYGIIFGAVYYKYRNIWYPVIIHFFVNWTQNVLVHYLR